METRTFDCWEVEVAVYASLKEIRETGFRLDGEPEKFKVTITVEKDND